MKRLVIFDLDGTLVDSRLDIAAAANAARARVGLASLPVEKVAGFVGDGARNLVARTLGPEHHALFDAALEAFFAFYAEHLVDQTRPYPGIPELLAELPGPLAVLTNKPGALARTLCDRLGLTERFARIRGDGDVPARKPDPAGALELCAQLGFEPGLARLVGDSKADAGAARAAAIPFCGVTWGFGSEGELREHGAMNLFADVPALRRALLE
jgi:phosphoglycolate phosphatase